MPSPAWIEVRSFKPRIGQSGLRRIKTEPRGRLVLGGDMALPYTRALHDPLVGRLQRFFEIGIADDALGKIRANPQNDRTELA
jgi:hypothetical protein